MVDGRTIVLDGKFLSLNQVMNFIENKTLVVEISKQAENRVNSTRNQLEQWLSEDKKVIYGVTTGLGKLKDCLVSEEDQSTYQKNVLYSHAVGLGDYFHNDIIRLALLLRVNVLCRGNSGVRLALIERIIAFINRGIIPRVPQIGSLGVGDLQPMAHVGLCLSGYEEGIVFHEGKTISITKVLAPKGIIPLEFPLAAREALALMSGSTVLLAASIYSYYNALKLTTIADGSAALNFEAMRGEISTFDPRIHEARNFKPQMEEAINLSRLLQGSEWTTKEGRMRLGELKPRVQDAVSFRATPQVHGSVRDVLNYIQTVLQREINASTDNPLLFLGVGGYESISGGNFHGSLLAYSMDFLAIVLTDLAVLSERRSARLLDPVMSYGLPSNLVANSIGLNTGFALVQADATALVGEMRILATPASVGSVPSKGNQEDHNSMGMGAVRKVMSIIEHLEKVLAVELLCAAQAVDLISKPMSGLSMGKGTTEIYKHLRKSSQVMLEDRYIRKDLLSIIEVVKQDSLFNCLKAYTDIESKFNFDYII